tara:strand:- start:489 stop:1892 length:1404 start_codon:yes stop_codon:yes gene_type:complete
MNKFSFFYLGTFCILISILSFFNIIYSYYFNLYLNLDTYLYTLLISLIIGIFLILKKNILTKLNIYHKILTVVIGYIFLPIIISIPFYLSIYNLSFLNSYFEAISGFTSTGFTIFDNIKHIDESLIIWRSTSQWIGGLYFLFSIILLIDIFDENFKKTLTNFLSLNLSETLKQSLKIILFYSLITLLIFIILKIFNFRTFDSFNLSMSLISSGGFLPFNDITIILNSKIKIIIFSLLMLSSYFSLFLGYNLIFKKKSFNFYSEDFYLLIYLVIIIALSYFFFAKDYNFSSIFFSICSSVSNIGFSIDNKNYFFEIFYLTLVIIGGSFFSTSSGLRLYKIYSIFIFSINELISHAKPKNIFVNKLFLSDSKIKNEDINKYFLSLLFLIVSVFLLSVLLSIYDFSFENSIKLAVLTLLNTVNSTNYIPEQINFENLSVFTKYLLIIFMMIGRIELLTIVIFLKKIFIKY